jgi:hypothetical protein
MKKMAVIGAGTMGNGIAHVFAQKEFQKKVQSEMILAEDGALIELPAGTFTFTLAFLRSRPVPWQLGQGSEITLPSPRQLGQVVTSEHPDILSPYREINNPCSVNLANLA